MKNQTQSAIEAATSLREVRTIVSAMTDEEFDTWATEYGWTPVSVDGSPTPDSKAQDSCLLAWSADEVLQADIYNDPMILRTTLRGEYEESWK